MTRAAVLAVLAACGDGLVEEPEQTSVSGTRLAIQRYRYDDGTEQVEPTALYDRTAHAQCRPQLWSDGRSRCVPLADPVVYLDPACAMPVGRAIAITHATHYLGFEAATGLPARVYEATRTTVEVPTYYTSTAEGCTGPLTSEAGVSYYELGPEQDGGALAELRDGELGTGRIALRTLESDDGLLLITGARDRELGPCQPAASPRGGVWCAPLAAARAVHYLDPACAEPAIATGAGDTPPAIAAIVEATGCETYRAIGREHVGTVYRRDGDTCVPEVVSDQRTFGLGGELEPVALARSLEPAPGRRLQRIVLDAGELRFFDDSVFDTTTHSDCRPRQLGQLPRCLPTPLAGTLRLRTAGCTGDLIVSEVPRRACQRPAFAGSRQSVRAIGAPIAEPAFTLAGTVCVPYAPAAGAELLGVGPPLDPMTFAGAILFGER